MNIGIIPITGYPSFDYFFTIIFVLGVVSVGPSLLFRLLRW